jgi:hypothetical protein
VRSRNAWASWLRTKERCPTKDAAGSMVVGAAPITAANPLGRASLAKAPDAAALERASMMPVSFGSLLICCCCLQRGYIGQQL